MTKLYKLLLFISCFYITQNTYAAERLSSKDYQKLIDLGFNKLDAYADDYSDSEAYWYSLEEHLSLKPKFLALLTQPMKVDGKEQVNRHVYNSKHHFFASRKEKCDKDGSKTLSFLKKCKVLKMPVIDDSFISVENFAKMTLDHCNETKVKNLKTKDGKAIKVTDEKSCNIKFINFKKYEFAKVLKEVGSSSGKEDKKEKSKKNNLDDFKKQCEDLGFTPKTEKFGDCVLKLAEIANNS